jgi:hypothetical protein
MLSRTRIGLLLGLLGLTGLAAARAWGQGGPPFRTDDPDTPGNRHWELNVGFLGQRNPGAGAYQTPDFDLNYGLGDRLQLKYEIPVAIEETRPQPATAGDLAVPAQVIVGVGSSYPGIKWRFYEHHPGETLFRGGWGTGLLGVFGAGAHRAPEAAPAAEGQEANFSISTYPQLALNNPTSAVRRGLVASGPDFYLPIEFNGKYKWLRYNGEIGYNFGNRTLPQSWNRGLLLGHEFSGSLEAYVEIYDTQDANRLPAGRGVGNFATGLPKQRQTTIGGGGRQSLNKAKTLNLLLMGARSFQTILASNSQPSWVAYVGVQILWGGDHPVTPQVEQKVPNESRR